MLSIPDLRAEIEVAGYVVVATEDGRILSSRSRPDLASPTALVVPVTDALKDVSPSGVVTGSMDRDAFWLVAAFYLDEEALTRLEDDPVDAVDLLETLAASGLEWQAHPLEDVL